MANRSNVHPSKFLGAIKTLILAVALDMLIDEIRAAQQRTLKTLAANYRTGPQ